MKYPFLFLFISVFLATIVFVMLCFATFAEVKEILERKANVEGLPSD
jgi:hypothetical protein